MTGNYFRFGTLNYLIVEADKVDDILYIMWDKDERTLKIIVKPNYDIGSVLDFRKNHVPYEIYSKVIVEENYELLKQGGL